MKNTKSFVLREAELPAISVLRLGLHFLQIRIKFNLTDDTKMHLDSFNRRVN